MTIVGYFIALGVAVTAVTFAFFSFDVNIYLENISVQNTQVDGDQSSDASLEIMVTNAWTNIIQPSSNLKFNRIALGVNGNVDLIIKGSSLLMSLDPNSNASSTKAIDHDVLESVKDLQETFKFFLSKGAGGERFFRQSDMFQNILTTAKNISNIEFFIGGNAALMAQKLAVIMSDDGQVLLGVPLGPTLKSLLDPRLKTTGSSLMEDDEYHLILEYGKGEKWSDTSAPIASRFIFSHDQSNSRMTAVEPLMKSLDNFNPDLLVLSGFHLLESLNPSFWKRRITDIAALLSPLSPSTPIHVELAAMVDKDCMAELMQQIMPRVDSIGLNEQELWMVCLNGGGPHCTGRNPDGPPSIAIAADILHWMLEKLSKVQGSRLTRIHFHTLTYHIIAVTVSSSWRNQAWAVLAGTRVASMQACDDLERVRPEKLELRISGKIQLSLTSRDAAFTRHFDPANPVMSWNRSEMSFHFTPVLVCREPVKTVGLGDAISATGLYYSGFER